MQIILLLNLKITIFLHEAIVCRTRSVAKNSLVEKIRTMKCLQSFLLKYDKMISLKPLVIFYYL